MRIIRRERSKGRNISKGSDSPITIKNIEEKLIDCPDIIRKECI